MSKKELIDGLNEDLAAELGTVIRYTYQSSKAMGFVGMQFREMLEDEISDELGHAAFLMDAIVNLGGEPTTTPQEFEKPETLKAMIEVDIKMEKGDVENYVKHAELADELGLIDLKLKLEDMAADEAGHARELNRLLQGM
jgi:bacterioferritin